MEGSIQIKSAKIGKFRKKEMEKLKSMMVKTHQQAAKVIYEMEGSIQIKLAKISKKSKI